MTLNIEEGHTTNNDIGVYELSIILTDDSDLQKYYNLQLVVEENSQQDCVENEQLNCWTETVDDQEIEVC